MALDGVEDVVDLGRRRVDERAAGAQHLERGGDAAEPERREERHRPISLDMRKIGASARGLVTTDHWLWTTAFG